MSNITVVFDMPNVTSAQYDQVIDGLEAAGAGNPKGRLYHVASPKEGGWLVVDVWESGELLDQFAQTLVSIMQKAGVTLPNLRFTRYTKVSSDKFRLHSLLFERRISNVYRTE